DDGPARPAIAAQVSKLPALAVASRGGRARVGGAAVARSTVGARDGDADQAGAPRAPAGCAAEGGVGGRDGRELADSQRPGCDDSRDALESARARSAQSAGG